MPSDGVSLSRADRYIAETLGILSRSQIKARGAALEVDGRPAKLSRPLKPGEHLVITWTEEPSPGLEPEDLPLSVLYEDDRVLVLDKAQGMVTHPGAGNRRGTLANAVLGYLLAAARFSATGVDGGFASGGEGGFASGGEGGFDAPPRGGIVHRLDKDTSGVIIVAKDAESLAFLASQFKDRTTRKEYLAITKGLPREAAGLHGEWQRLENRLGRDRRDRKRFAEVAEGGRIAVTDWRIAAIYGDFALVHLRPRTGRTHQLRVHLAGLGAPIVGDPIYRRGGNGTRESFSGAVSPGLMLHAWKLAIVLPGESEALQFIAPVPRRFTALLTLLETRFGKKKPQRS
jgi:23S rRNA pseudouridine1911/1915/1917 synthase